MLARGRGLCHHQPVSPAVLVAARLLAAPEASPPALPESGDAPLRWVADETQCPDATAVRATVEELAGRWPARHELEVDAFVRQEPDAWTMVLTVVVSGRVHRQQLEAESCPALTRAAALIVAVSIDPVASATEVPMPIEVSTAPGQRAEREPGRVNARATDVAPGRRRPAMTPTLGVGWGVVSGMTPGISSGPALSLGLDFERAYVGLVGRGVLPRAADGARVFAGTVAARGCLASRPSVVRGILCAGAEAGALQAEGTGDGARTQRFPWFAGTVGAGMRWGFADRVALTVDVEGAVALVDAQVVLGPVSAPDPTIAFANPRLGLRAGLGLQFRFSGPR